MISSVLSNGCTLLSEVSTAPAFTMAWQDSPLDHLIALPLLLTRLHRTFATLSLLKSAQQAIVVAVVCHRHPHWPSQYNDTYRPHQMSLHKHVC